MTGLFATAVLAVHVAVILFNVVGMIAIPLGAWRGWSFVRVFWWRALHVASWAVVAIQALLGEACFLTIWEGALRGAGGETMPLVERWVRAAIYWPLPLWVFAAIYIAALVYVLALWRLVPPSPVDHD